jgi:quercetin dioxygenase-like cupin family protein
MNGSCELPASGVLISAAARVTPAGSRVHRFLPGTPNAWSGVAIQDYKAAADHHCGVIRSVLVGEGGEKSSFHVRYFEVVPGGFSTLERHDHEHFVLVLRGEGVVRLGDGEHPLAFGDAVHVASGEVHQLRNASATEPFGFLCVVDAERDRPVPV